MDKVKKIYNMLTNTLIKNRLLLVSLYIQNIIFMIVTLLFINNIISRGKLYGEIDFLLIKNYTNFTVMFMFFVVFAFSPFFISRTINTLYKTKQIEYLLASSISIKHIVFASYVRGLTCVIILLFSSLPIASAALCFGGISIIRLIKILLTLIAYLLLFTSFCSMISSIVYDANMCIILSYMLGFILFVINSYIIKYSINGIFGLIVYFASAFVLSVLFINKAIKCDFKI